MLFLCAANSSKTFAQNGKIDSLAQLGVCTAEGFAIPSIIGMPRGKGIELFQERIPSYGMQSLQTLQDSAFSEEVRRTKRFSFKVRVPVINRDDFQFVVGAQYSQQEFAFENPELVSDDFYRTLQDKELKSAGVNLYAIKPFIGNKYLAARLSTRLNGDFNEGNTLSYLKTTFSVLLGYKRNAQSTWGYGLSYSNTFGNSSVYPLFFLKTKIKPDLAVQLMLPVSARLIYTPNDKNTVLFTTKFEGDNYNISLPELQENNLYLEKTDLKALLTYEREIHDFLWVSVTTGLRWNINFDVSDEYQYFERAIPVGNQDHILISNELDMAPVLKFGVFIVPPRKWMD